MNLPKSPKGKSKWSSIRDKNNLNKIRIQKFIEEIKNTNNFMKKNELIFEKYSKSKGTNLLNLFGNQNLNPNHVIPKKPMINIRKNIIAQKFTLMLKKQYNAHNLNQKQIQLLKDQSYYKITEFAKRRQKMQNHFSKYSNEQERVSMTAAAKYKILVCLNFTIEYLIKTKPVFVFKRLFKLILKVKEPDGMFRICVDLVSLVFIVYEILEIPLLLSFPEIDNNNLDFMSNFITFYFIGDLIMSFNTAFYKRGIIVKDRKQIARNYLSHWFLIDAISSFPYDIVVNSVSNINSSSDDDADSSLELNSKLILMIRFIKFLKILRLLRIMKLKHIFSKIEDYLQLSPSFNAISAFIRLCFLIICIAHWFACIWHLVAIYEENYYMVTWLKSAGLADAVWTERYVTSLYWAITTMITVGYGDVVPLTVPEKLYTIFCMLIACGVFGYTMNRVGTIFQSFEENSMEFKVKMFQINQYMKSKNVPKEMQARIRKYIQFTLDPNKRNQLDENSFFKCLSKNLKGEIVLFINGNIINQFDIFSSLISPHLLSKLPFFVNEQIYGPEEIVFSEDDAQKDTNIYFLKQGATKAFIRSTETDILEFSSGSTFGQVGFFSNLKWSYSVQSLDFISLFYLKRGDFLQVIEEEKLVEDAEVFHEIKDKLELYNDYRVLNMNCSSCNDDDHLINTCPFLHHVLNPEELVKNFSQSESNFRNHFRRNTERKKFHSKMDFILIQSSAFALRDIILIIKEEGINENYRIDIDIEDFLDENPEGFPLEYKIKEINTRNSPTNRDFHKCFEEQEMELSLQNKKDFNKSLSQFNRDVDPIIQSFNIDKIENFGRYFLYNNFLDITNVINKCAAQKLRDFTHNKDQKDSPEVLNRMIRITKSKTIKIRKSTNCSPTNNLKGKKPSSPPEKNDIESIPDKEKLKPRFSIFGKKDEKINREKEKMTSTSSKSKPEIKIFKDFEQIKDISPLLNSKGSKREMLKSENDIMELSPKIQKDNKGISPLDLKKKRKSTSCDGTYTLEDLLKETNLKELEQLVKLKQENP